MHFSIPLKFFNPWERPMSRFILQILGVAIFCMQMNFAVATDDWEKPVFDSGVSLKETVEIAFPEFEVDYLKKLAEDDKLILSLWSHCPGCLVAAVLEAEDSNTMTLSVSVLQREGNNVRQLAANEFKLDDFNWNNHIGLDFAPYRIRDKEFAFGVRISSNYRSDAHISSWTTLHLFRLSGNKISRIVKLQDMDGSSIEGPFFHGDDGSENDKEGNDEDRTERVFGSTVHIGPLAPNGFYDLIVKKTIKERNVRSEQILKQEKSVEKYRWRGTVYELVK
jgi:hypothetical protein